MEIEKGLGLSRQIGWGLQAQDRLVCLAQVCDHWMVCRKRRMVTRNVCANPDELLSVRVQYSQGGPGNLQSLRQLVRQHHR